MAGSGPGDTFKSDKWLYGWEQPSQGSLQRGSYQLPPRSQPQELGLSLFNHRMEKLRFRLKQSVPAGSYE